MKLLLKAVRMPMHDRILLIKTFVLLGMVRFGLWLLPFRILQRVLERLSCNPNLTPAASIRASVVNKIVWAIDISSRWMPGEVKCLARALTAEVLIRRRGYSPDLRIGVAKDENNHLEAHAWLELQGYVVIGLLPDLQRFVPMPSLDVTVL